LREAAGRRLARIGEGLPVDREGIVESVFNQTVQGF
jgi:hypothetical protein